jgi:hypothetical protein
MGASRERAAIRQSADEAEPEARVIMRKLAMRLSPVVCDDDLELVGDLTHTYVQRPRLFVRIGVDDNVGDRLGEAELDAVELRIREADVARDPGDGISQRPDRLRSRINAQDQHCCHVAGIPARRLPQTNGSWAWDVEGLRG